MNNLNGLIDRYVGSLICISDYTLSRYNLFTEYTQARKCNFEARESGLIIGSKGIRH